MARWVVPWVAARLQGKVRRSTPSFHVATLQRLEGVPVAGLGAPRCLEERPGAWPIGHTHQ
jgi:hypothetical protein